jgi:hypothetical protein
MRSFKKYSWLLVCSITVSLYLFDMTVATAAPKQNALVSGRTAYVPATVSQNTAQDTVSTAEAFKEWLEAHKNDGGSVRLTDNIVLKEFYEFSPNGAGRPDIIVDTDTYTITAAGNIMFLSDGHLIFRGKGISRGMFRAARGGILTLDGVIVEDVSQSASTQYALWQEEGAGLILGNTYAAYKVSGEIHYADTPFAMRPSSVCVVVEKEQSAEGLFPTQIRCNVNYQGQVQYDKLMPVSWELAGTEEQQEKRQRFCVEGFSDQAVYQVPPVCTVVYNDYPLTFTDVRVSIKGKAYYFEGGYTKPKTDLPMTVTSEYSFDGINWMIFSEDEVTDADASFKIYFPCKEWDTVQNPYTYIRLQGEKEGRTYLSNVLRCKADNMNEVEDLGGSRGGGTSIVNPPKEPEEDSAVTSPELTEALGSQTSNTHNAPQDGKERETESGEHKSKDKDTEAYGTDIASDADIPESDNSNASQNTADDDLPINSQVSSSPHDMPASETVVPENTNSTAHLSIESPENTGESEDTEQYAMAGDDDRDADLAEPGSAPVYEETADIVSEVPLSSEGEMKYAGKDQQISVKQEPDTALNLVLVLGFVTVSAGVGVVGYFVHTSRLRRYKRKRKAAKRSSHKKDKRRKR